MMRLLRKSWLLLAILICTAAFVPLVMSFANNYDPALLKVSIYIFMAGIIFALICVILVLITSATRKRSTKA